MFFSSIYKFLCVSELPPGKTKFPFSIIPVLFYYLIFSPFSFRFCRCIYFFIFDVRFSARIVFFARFCLVLFGISLSGSVIVFLSVFRFFFFDFLFQEARYLQCAVAGEGAGQPDRLCECKLQWDLVHMQSGRLDSLAQPTPH